MYALHDGDRQRATPHTRGQCPTCSARVISKCGPLVVWHWAHVHSADCDVWAEPDTAWHRGWQNVVPEVRREVRMGPHRADIVTNTGVVVELQTKALPAADVAAREAFYGNMVWVFNAEEPYEDRRLDLRQKPGHVTFRWRHARKSVSLCKKQVFLDLGEGHGLLQIHKLYLDGLCSGWGKRVADDTFIEWLNAPAAPVTGQLSLQEFAKRLAPPAIPLFRDMGGHVPCTCDVDNRWACGVHGIPAA